MDNGVYRAAPGKAKYLQISAELFEFVFLVFRDVIYFIVNIQLTPVE